MNDRWRLSAAFYRAAALVAFGIGTGLSTGRFDLVVLAAPIALGMVLALVWAPADFRSRPTAQARTARGQVAGTELPVATTIAGLRHAELVSVAVPLSTSAPIGDVRVLPGGADRELLVQAENRSWGPTVVARPDLVAIGPDGLTTFGPVAGSVVQQLVLPAVPLVAPLPLPAIDGGWAGSHVSRRPGVGGDLIDLRKFAPGDRMRSVHWRAFARRGELFTRRTLSDADAEITVILDNRFCIGPRVPAPPTDWLGHLITQTADLITLWQDRRSERRGGPTRQERIQARHNTKMTSLDLTVRVAGAIAKAHLKAGDRVGIQTIGYDRRTLRSRSGTGHLQRIRYFLANTKTSASVLAPVARWGLRPGGVVVICSPITDAQIEAAAIECAAHGHRTVLVSTLPQQALVSRALPADRPHLQLASVDRALRIERIRAAGIPVLDATTDSMDLQLALALRALRGRR